MRQKISDGLDFWMIDSIAVAVIVILLALIWRRWNGQERSNLLKRLALIPLWILGVFLLLRNPSPNVPEKNSGPNVILLGIDALRPDHLQQNGYHRETAPNLENLLQESVVFTDAYATIARTYPSWSSILTGKWPYNNGIRDNLPPPDLLVPKVPLLTKKMQEAGYHTTFLTDDSRFSYMVPEMGFDEIVQPKVGIINFAISVTEPRFRVYHGLLHNPIGFSISPTLRHNQAFGRSYRPELFSDEVINSLAASAQNDKFMLALHSCVLHAPGDRNYPYSRMFEQRGYQGKNRFRYSKSGSTMLPANVKGSDTKDEVNEQDLKIYDSGMQMADELVGKLVEHLKSSGLWENTLIVTFSDHGEELWSADLPYDYHGPNHGFHPYGDGQHHVMLGFRFPDGKHAGEEVSETVRLIDIAPTLAEYFQLNWPESVDGDSVLGLLTGERESEKRLVYVETGVSERKYWNKGHLRYPFRTLSQRYEIHDENIIHVKKEFMESIIQVKDRFVQMGRWKLVWRPLKKGYTVELFDRSTDPLNLNNLYSENRGIAAHLGLKLQPFLEDDGVKSSYFKRWAVLAEKFPEPDWFQETGK